MYPYVSIFGWQLPSYWIMSMCGLLIAYGFLMLYRKKFTIASMDVLHLFLFAIIGALAGAKLLHLIIILPIIIGNFGFLMQNLDVLADLLVSGYVFYGGLIGGFLFCLWYCKMFKISMGEVSELFAPALPLFHIFGRIGCFLAGCCYGIEVPWGVVYTNSASGPNGVPLLPLQLIESGCNVLIFAAVLVFGHFYRGRRLAFPFYIVAYAVCRFVLEFFRGDAVRGVFLLSTSQWVALGLVAAVFIWFFAVYRRKKPQAA